jgi:glycosyltransferase involved in cell wall biosynthesis
VHIGFYSLRDEARLSGEAAASAQLRQLAGELGLAFEAMSPPTGRGGRLLDTGRRLARLRRLSARSSASHLIVKVPTAAQLPLVHLATTGFRGRRVVWVDGLLWRLDLSLRQTLALAAHEPALLAARALANNGAWLRGARGVDCEVVVSSRLQRDELAARLPRARVHVVPNGVRRLAPRQGRRSGSFTAGYLGHAYLTKGVGELVAAAAAAGVPLRCAFSGLGSRRLVGAARRAGAAVLGEVDVAELLASIDLLVAPFWASWGTHAFPSVLLEAMQVGVPVLTTDLPLMRELFPGELAVLAPAGDARALSRRLADIASGNLALPSPSRLRAHFEAHHSAARVAAGWRALLCPDEPAGERPSQ